MRRSQSRGQASLRFERLFDLFNGQPSLRHSHLDKHQPPHHAI